MKIHILAVALVAALPLRAMAQAQQQVRAPIAMYWMSIETAGGMGVALPPGMGAMVPPGMAGGKRMNLELGSSQTASGDPRAGHAIPPGLSMGQSLPLVTPRSERAPVRERNDEEPEFERPKGRVVIYWGCGEQVRSGQPVIFDFAKMNSQEAARAFRSVAISRSRGPAPSRNRTYGTWPNQEDSRQVPASASLKGDQVIAGNYSPEIRFSIGDRHDFMESVAFAPVVKTPGGAFSVKWKSVPTAIGYFATAVGQGDNQADIVMWSSSDVQTMGQALMDYIAPAEIERLIREKVVMSPRTTDCTVPSGIFKSEGSMFNFIAYGDELNLVHPPRPSDPKLVWEQVWAVKLRLKSTAMTLLAEGDARDAAATRERGPAAAPQRDTESRQSERPQTPSDAAKQGVRVLRGILGF
jgi:hypothetical protein